VYRDFAAIFARYRDVLAVVFDGHLHERAYCGSIKPNFPNPLMQAFCAEQATKAIPHNAMIATTVAAVAALFITG
jgi:hypothetical protein